MSIGAESEDTPKSKRIYNPSESVSGEALAKFLSQHQVVLPPITENRFILNLAVGKFQKANAF